MEPYVDVFAHDSLFVLEVEGRGLVHERPREADRFFDVLHESPARFQTWVVIERRPDLRAHLLGIGRWRSGFIVGVPTINSMVKQCLATQGFGLGLCLTVLCYTMLRAQYRCFVIIFVDLWAKFGGLCNHLNAINLVFY